MSARWTILCDAAELAVECAQVASELDLQLEPRVEADPAAHALEMRGEGASVALLLSDPPSPETLVRLAAASSPPPPLVIGMIAGGEPPPSYDLACDLGLAAVHEVRALVSALALCETELESPWVPSTRGLPAVDRNRLARISSASERGQGQLLRADQGRLAFRGASGATHPLGEPRDVAAALEALQRAHGVTRPPMPEVEGVDPQAVLDVIFGPARSLSDPASKSALEPYDVPVPTEELCTSPSRAAAEAARIGFPVRIALASPDLRVWDHPDLAADGLDNAARVRDVFRQIMALAGTRTPDARLLGVVVSATTAAHALLRVHVTPLPEGLALAEIGFADPHGLASDDTTQTVLPAPVGRLHTAIARLRGSPLVLEGSTPDQRRTVSAIGDVLLRLASFVHDWREQVTSVEVQPLALLVGGAVEIREARVTVGDAFERSLEPPAESTGA